MKTYKIHFIRNGMTRENAEGRYIGHTDAPLSPEGEEEIARLAEQFEYPPAQAVFSSPLKRCLGTAAIVYPDKTPIVLHDLIEYNFGSFEGKTAAQLASSPVFPAWLAGDPDAVPPFGESRDAFSVRIEQCFLMLVNGLLKTGTDTAAVVTHGGIIAALLEVFGVPEHPMSEWLSPSGCGYTVRITPSVWSKVFKFEIIAEIPAPRDDLD